jgi:hypothetical protein
MLDIFRRQRVQPEAVAGVTPVAIQPHFLKSHQNRIPRLGSLDVERSGQRIARLRVALDILVILSGGVESLGDHDVARLDALQYLVLVRKRAVISGRDQLVRFRMSRRAKER